MPEHTIGIRAMVTSQHELYRYRSGGIEVRSDRALPGLRSAGETISDHVLTLVTGPQATVPHDLPEGEVILDADFDRRLYCGVRDRDGYVLRFPGLCEVRLSPTLRDGECHMDPEADADLAAILLSGTMLAFVLALSGRCVLHASAVEVNGRGLAFVGHSGVGKSTLTVATCSAGARLITEDVLVATPGDEPACLPGNCDIRVREKAYSLLDGVDWPTTTTGDHRRAVRPPFTELDHVPLDTIIIPRPSRRAKSLTVEQLPPSQAAMRLIAFPRVLGLTDGGVNRRQFEAVGRIVRSVPVLVATVPWGPPFSPEIGEELLALMRGS